MSVTTPVSGFSELVESVIGSYQTEAKTRHIDAGELANRDAVIEIIHLLRELLFPGYFGRQDLASSTLKYHVGELLLDIQEKLTRQVHNALLHRATDNNARTRADQIVRDFLATVPRLRAILATDVQAAFDGDPAAADTDEIVFSYPGFFAVSVYRLAHELHVRDVPLVPRIMTEYAHSVTGIDIHAGAIIDEYFFIDHGTGVVIGETTIIGKRVKLYQGVTLGALSTRGGQKLRGVKRHPTLEDEVTVYSGASILGGETIIGKGVVISSNVFITQSVPPRTRVTVKNPELQYRDQKPREFRQELPLDWVI
ncbi:MAG: serine acetyltransferase [Tepidisphaeraceae bacterium]